jgi:hypothetical protein
MDYGYGRQSGGRRPLSYGELMEQRRRAPAPQPTYVEPMSEQVAKPKGQGRRGFVMASLGTLCFALLAAVAVGGYLWYKQAHVIIPANIKKQVTFVIFYPQNNSVVQVNKKTLLYEPDKKLLSYTGKFAGSGTSFTLSEQTTPDSFVDIPQAYTKLLSSLNQYDSFGTANGTVALTHPKELNGGESAVMNAKGTLLFVRPSGTVTSDDWRRLFNNLQVQN